MSLSEFYAYLRILAKRWWIFVILCGATCGAILLSFRTAPPQYQASAHFLVNVPPSSDVSLYPGADRPTRAQQIESTQAAFMEVLKSPTVLYRAAKSLGLSMSSDELNRRVTVEKPLKSEFVWVTVQANDPQKAADLANTLVDTGKQYYGVVLSEPATSSRKFISGQVDTASRNVQAEKQKLTNFKTQHQVGDLPSEISVERSLIWNLVLEKSKAAVANQAGEATFNAILAEHEAELQRLTSLSDDYAALLDNIKRAETNYEFLLDKETEAKLTENEILNTGYIQVVEPAYPPTKPISSFDAKIFGVGAVLSLLASVVMAFVLEYLESQQPKRVREESSYAAS